MVLGCRVCLKQTTHVDREVGGALSARGADDVARLVHARQDMQGRHTGGDSAHDVGLEAVTDSERVLRAHKLAGTAVDTRLRLATSDRTLARRVLDSADERTVAQCLAALDRQGCIKVRGVEGRPALDGESAFGQQRPVDLLVKALNNGHRLLIGAVHQDKATLLESETQTGAADDEYLRALLELFSHDRCDVHRGGHDHVRRRLEVHGVKLVGHLLGGTHRIVGDEGGSHAGLARLDHRRGRVLDLLVTGPRSTVKVEQCAVVFFSQSRARATQRGTLAIHVGISVQGDIDNLCILDLGGHRRDDLCGFVVATKVEQSLRLDLHQAAAQFVVSFSRQHCKCIVNDHEANLSLAEIRTRAGGDEHELHLLGKVEGRGIGGVDDFDGLFRMAEPTLSVGFHGTQRRIAPHATHGTNLSQSFLVAPRSIGGKRSSLAYNVDSACTCNSGLRMLVGSLGIKIDQLAGHHQVAGNDVTIGTRKGGQSAQSIAVELLSADAGRNRRLITVGRDVLIRRGVVLVTAVVTRCTPASAILEAAAAVVATRVATAVPTTIITRTKATAVVVTTLETAALTITTVVAEATTAIITPLETTITVTTIVATEPTTVPTVLEIAAAVVATRVATAVPTTIITRTKATAVVVTTLETAALTITTVVAEATTAIITPLETASLTAGGAFAIAIAPLRLALLVSTTAEFAASSSLFCHGVYPLFLRR